MAEATVKARILLDTSSISGISKSTGVYSGGVGKKTPTDDIMLKYVKPVMALYLSKNTTNTLFNAAKEAAKALFTPIGAAAAAFVAGAAAVNEFADRASKALDAQDKAMTGLRVEGIPLSKEAKEEIKRLQTPTLTQSSTEMARYADLATRYGYDSPNASTKGQKETPRIDIETGKLYGNAEMQRDAQKEALRLYTETMDKNKEASGITIDLSDSYQELNDRIQRAATENFKYAAVSTKVGSVTDYLIGSIMGESQQSKIATGIKSDEINVRKNSAIAITNEAIAMERLASARERADKSKEVKSSYTPSSTSKAQTKSQISTMNSKYGQDEVLAMITGDKYNFLKNIKTEQPDKYKQIVEAFANG